MVYKTGEQSRPIQSGNLSKALTLMVIGLTLLLVVGIFFWFIEVRGVDGTHFIDFNIFFPACCSTHWIF